MSFADAVGQLLATEHGLKLIAIDFDLTLVDCHTRKWKGSATKLERHVRPFFRTLVRQALDRDLPVAVVTFSPDSELIGGVLRAAFGDAASSKILLRCHDDTWTVPPFASLPQSWHYIPRKLKVEHLLSVVGELRTQRRQSVDPGEVLLLDDDAENVRAAQQAGVRAAMLLPNEANSGEEALLETLRRHLVNGEALPLLVRRRSSACATM